MTDIEEQIQEALKSTGVLRFPGDRFSLAAAVMPLAKRAQAEAWAQGAARVVNANRAARLVTPTDNPYIEKEAGA